MKKLLFIFSFLGFLQISTADIFTGAWTGKGTKTVQSGSQPVAIKIDVTIQQLSDKLIILDCGSDADNVRCYSSHYEIRNGDQIFEQDRKIGDLFSGRITIYNGHQQAAEQMLFKFATPTKLHYRYSYLNFDGQMETRFVILKPK